MYVCMTVLSTTKPEVEIAIEQILSSRGRPMSVNVGSDISESGMVQHVVVAVGIASLSLSVKKLFLLPVSGPTFWVPDVGQCRTMSTVPCASRAWWKMGVSSWSRRSRVAISCCSRVIVWFLNVKFFVSKPPYWYLRLIDTVTSYVTVFHVAFLRGKRRLGKRPRGKRQRGKRPRGPAQSKHKEMTAYFTAFI